MIMNTGRKIRIKFPVKVIIGLVLIELVGIQAYAGSEFQGSSEEDTEQVTKVYYLQNGNALGVAKVLEIMYSDSKVRPHIVADDRTNSLKVTALAETQKEVEVNIAKLDVKSGQILVEATYIEVPTKELDKYDLDFKSHGGILAGKTSDFSFGLVRASTLESLMKNDSVKVLASPKILTADREEANVQIGRDIHYMEKVENDLFQLKTITNLGAFFKVTPAIKSDNTIELDLDFKMCSIGKRFKVPEAPDLDIGRPALNIRQAQTKMRVGDGETAVISGLTGSVKGIETSCLLLVTAHALLK